MRYQLIHTNGRDQLATVDFQTRRGNQVEICLTWKANTTRSMEMPEGEGNAWTSFHTSREGARRYYRKLVKNRGFKLNPLIPTKSDWRK